MGRDGFVAVGVAGRCDGIGGAGGGETYQGGGGGRGGLLSGLMVNRGKVCQPFSSELRTLIIQVS